MKRLFNTIFGSAARTPQPEPFSVGQPKVPSVRPSEVPSLFRLLEIGDNREIVGIFPCEGYSLLFVLEGSVEVSFEGAFRHLVGVGQLLVFHNPSLRSVVAQSGSALILHTPPEEVVRMLNVCVEKFHRPTSETLPVPPLLASWLGELRAELEAEGGMICSAEKEQSFSDCLLASTTSSGLLGEVYVAYLFRKKSPREKQKRIANPMKTEVHTISE